MYQMEQKEFKLLNFYELHHFLKLRSELKIQIEPDCTLWQKD